MKKPFIILYNFYKIKTKLKKKKTLGLIKKGH